MNRNAISAALLSWCIISQTAFAGVQAIYYVSPNGSDANNGTSETTPFKTIEKARNTVRTINGNMTGDIIVYLRGGTYNVSNTIAFTASDSGSNGFNVKYINYPNEKPVVSGGVAITSWTLHDSAKGIYKASVPVGTGFRQLYVNGVKATRARQPNVGSFNQLTSWDVPGKRIKIPANKISNWANLTSVEMTIHMNFTQSILRLASYTSDASYAYLKFNPVEESIVFPRQNPGKANSQPYYWQNAYEFIDQGGEWYLNKNSNTVFYKPRTNENMSTASVIRPSTETLVSVTGTLASPVKNIWFYGITFQHTNWLRPDSNGNVEGQAGNTTIWVASTDGDLNRVTRQPAAVYVNSAENCRFEWNTFRDCGATGLDLHYGNHYNEVIGNVFRYIAGMGLNISKYSDESVEMHTVYNPSDSREVDRHNVFRNNWADNCAQDYAGSIGISAGWTNTLTIANNEVTNMPYSGISVGWGWKTVPSAMKGNVISFNRIDNVMRSPQCDGAGIYALSYAPQSVMDRNYITDVVRQPLAGGFPVAGIYLDLGYDDSTVTNNVIANCSNFIHSPLVKNTYMGNNVASDSTIMAEAGIGASHTAIKNMGVPPTLDLQTGTTLNFYATTDTTVHQNQAGVVLNNANELGIKASSTAARRGFVRFNVKGLAGRTISSIKLRLTEAQTGGAGNTSFEVRKCTSATLNEDTTTWNTQPTFASTASGSWSGTLSQNGVIDITLANSTITADGIVDLALIPLSGSGDNVFRTRELNGGPQLIIAVSGGGGGGTPGSVSYAAIADAMVDETVPTANTGAAKEIAVKYVVSKSRNSYLRFAVSGITGRTVTAVKLRLKESTLSSQGDTKFDVKKVTGSWTEAGVTWNTKPTVASTVYGSYTGGLLTDGQVLDIPINTSLITGDGNYDLALIPTAMPTNDSAFSSKEGSQAPQLVIEYQ
jgi:hypothetical protein